MALAPGMIRDRKTGKVRRKTRLSAAQKSARHRRKGRHESSTVKLKIMKAVKKEIRSGRDKSGRRSRTKRAA